MGRSSLAGPGRKCTPVVGNSVCKAQRCEVVRDVEGRVAGWASMNMGVHQGPGIILEKCLLLTPGKLLSHPRNWSGNQRFCGVTDGFSRETHLRVSILLVDREVDWG